MSDSEGNIKTANQSDWEVIEREGIFVKLLRSELVIRF